MNRFGIKLYINYIYNIDGINYTVNSICHEGIGYRRYKYRLIDNKNFGIQLNILDKKIYE